MINFKERLSVYAAVSKDIVQGKKIPRNACDPAYLLDLESLAARMYTGFFMPYEPQSLFIQEGWGDKEIKSMGYSDLHPVPRRSLEAARFLEGKHGNFSVYGLTPETRYDAVLADNKFAQKKQGYRVLIRGDFATLAEVTQDILSRLSHPNPLSFPPIIVHDRAFWGELFNDETFDYQSLGIVFSTSESETKDLLSRAPSNEVKSPLFSTGMTLVNPKIIFATTDHIKFAQQQEVQSGYHGELHAAHTVVEPYQIPEEKTGSYTGNAFQKMVNIMEVVLERGLQDTATVQHNLVVHDGGLAVFLMNQQGERFTDIFTDERYFPSSAHAMNDVLAGPGVELAELYKSAPNLDHVVDQAYKKIDEVCRARPWFKPDDTTVFDTVIQMSIPLERFLTLYKNYSDSSKHQGKTRREICEVIARHHTLQVFDAMETKLLRKPRFISPPLSTDTTHFLTYGAEGHSRSEHPEWVMKDCPTTSTFRMVMEAYGTPENDRAADKKFERHRHPKIAVPQMLFGTRFSHDGTTKPLKEALLDLEINWRKGTEYWKKFKAAACQQSLTKSFAEAAYDHRKHVRDILAEHDFLYIPKDYKPSSPQEWLQSLLLVTSAMVQRQVFKRGAPRIVLERGAFADEIIKIFISLKQVGLIGQQFDHLVKLTNSPRESAAYINAMVHTIPEKVRPHIPTNDNISQIPMPENLTAVVYCSASNTNKIWAIEADLIGYKLAMSNIDLKLGGGKDGMMKAVADGYLKALARRVASGEKPTCKLHLIQCKATKTIEGEYEISEQYDHLEGYIDRRCHDSIEERRFDLQQSHLPLSLAGGLGTFEEILCELIAVDGNEKNNKEFVLHALSQEARLPESKIGYVYDYLDGVLRQAGVRHGLITVSNTPEEIFAKIDSKRRDYDRKSGHSVDTAVPTALSNSGFPVLAVA